mgnify:CR=1 FL=1
MADTKFTRDQYIRELKRLMDENPDIVKAIQEEHPDRFYAAIQDHFETYPELGKAKWRSRKGRNKITGSMPTKGDPGEYFRISKLGDGFTFKSQSSRAAHRKKYVSKRAEQIELNRKKYLGAVRDKAGKNFDDLVGPDNTFEMGGKTYNRKEYIDYEVDLAAKQNKLTDVELKKPQEFYPGKSTIGHSTSVYSEEAVEAPHAKYPESKIQNQADQGAEYAGKTERIKQAGMATDVDTAADMQLGTGEKVNDPTSGEVRNRIMRGEPEDLVKKQDILRKRLNTVDEQALALINKAKDYKAVKVIAKAAKNPLVKKAGFIIPGVGIAVAGGIVTTDVMAATKDPSAKNLAKLGLSTFDAGLEVLDVGTGGLSTPLTLALQVTSGIARYQIDKGTRSSSEMDMDARRAARRGQR